jgi:hypothetical protein
MKPSVGPAAVLPKRFEAAPQPVPGFGELMLKPGFVNCQRSLLTGLNGPAFKHAAALIKAKISFMNGNPPDCASFLARLR